MNERGMALAALFQATALSDNLAHQRPVTEAALYDLLESLFIFDPKRVDDLYTPETLQSGRVVARQCLLDGERLHLIGYAGSLLALQARLAGRSETSETLRTELERLAPRITNERPLTLDNLQALARLYSEHVSPLAPRIMVQGKPQALRDQRTVATIRSLLLAGVRAARLWAQLGGSRWHLVFRRKRLLQDL